MEHFCVREAKYNLGSNSSAHLFIFLNTECFYWLAPNLFITARRNCTILPFCGNSLFDLSYSKWVGAHLLSLTRKKTKWPKTRVWPPRPRTWLRAKISLWGYCRNRWNSGPVTRLLPSCGGFSTFLGTLQLGPPLMSSDQLLAHSPCFNSKRSCVAVHTKCSPLWALVTRSWESNAKLPIWSSYWFMDYSASPSPLHSWWDDPISPVTRCFENTFLV